MNEILDDNFESKESSCGKRTSTNQIFILLVEDDKLVQRITQMQLQELGYVVETASTGEQAYEMIQLRTYHLILMDIGLPGWDGCTTTKKIKEWEASKGHQTVVVALTAHADDRVRQECYAVGMVKVLIKPFKMCNVDSLIETVLMPKENEACDKKVVQSNSREDSVIDWPMAIELANGDTDVAQTIMQMLIESLPHERELMKQAYNRKDTAELAKATHKLHGGLCYCGTPRLKKATILLEEALRAKKNMHEIEHLFQQILLEIDAILILDGAGRGA